MPDYSVVLFHSTAHAIRAETVLRQAGLRIKMIPTPRQLSSDCGMALRFDRSLQGDIESALIEHKVPTNGIHTI